MTRTIEMTMRVNGAERTIAVEPRTTLVEALREACHLAGTRSGCDEGCVGHARSSSTGRRCGRV